MALDLDKSIDVCLTCRQRFGSIGEARKVFRELGALTVEQSDAVRGVDAAFLRKV